MKIPKLFKKAAAFVMAAVTALSIMPATAFAAGDIGTISFSHTYDSNGNAMRYNSSANIGGYTAGGTGNYKYRMFVDGENAFCIQPRVPLKTGNTLKKASSDTWNALSANQKKAVGLALLYGYQGNRNNLSGSDDEKWLATQTLVWEFVTGCREATGSYNRQAPPFTVCTSVQIMPTAEQGQCMTRLLRRCVSITPFRALWRVVRMTSQRNFPIRTESQRFTRTSSNYVRSEGWSLTKFKDNVIKILQNAEIQKSLLKGKLQYDIITV